MTDQGRSDLAAGRAVLDELQRSLADRIGPDRVAELHELLLKISV